jgi:hypothetical protein
MPNTTTTQDVQEQIFSTIRKGQEVTLDALKTWVETVQSVTAEAARRRGQHLQLCRAAAQQPEEVRGRGARSYLPADPRRGQQVRQVTHCGTAARDFSEPDRIVCAAAPKYRGCRAL